MIDIVGPEKRSEVMSRIRCTGSRAELRLLEVAREEVRRLLGSRVRVRANAKNVFGTPDVYVPRLGLAIFLDGCFFHACPWHGRMPKSNVDYWKPKIENNVRRDRRVTRNLRSCGYSVWRFWEHELRTSNLEKVRRRPERAVYRTMERIDS